MNLNLNNIITTLKQIAVLVSACKNPQTVLA
jgi:hypothetical protein